MVPPLYIYIIYIYIYIYNIYTIYIKFYFSPNAPVPLFFLKSFCFLLTSFLIQPFPWILSEKEAVCVSVGVDVI